ncbi:guanine nucleotide exchange protein smcr8b [Diretmus argenteus]
MIGSPDLLAFTGGEGFGEGVEYRDAQALPEELSVPLFPPSHPWVTSAQFHRDFILVAEFSEQVGPMPVLTIPDDPRVVGSFDLNHFSVRIMSMDYQASCPGPGHAPTHPSPASPAGPRLNFSEDSKVVLGDSAENVFAYVQHLTLYDLEARGMVRPYCMAYVSSDQDKLMEHFSELSTSFSQASDSLKTGNRRSFATELQRKLQELEYTRFTLQSGAELQTTANGFTEVEEKANELAVIERSISDHRDLLRQVTSYPNRKLKQPDFLPYDPADNLTDPSGLPDPEPCPAPASPSSRRFGHHLKPLEELTDAYFLSLTMQQLADTEHRLRGDRSVLSIARSTRLLSRKLTLTNFLFELWNPEDGVEEDEERDRAEAELQGAKVEGLTSEPRSLESFFSCVEEIPIKLEAGEGGRVTPDPEVAMEMMGSVSSGDSIEVLGTEKSYRTQRIFAGTDTREMSAGMVDVCFKRVAAEGGVRRSRASARRANSEDSIEVLSTTESIFPDDLKAITEEEAEHRPLGNGFRDEWAPVQEEELTKHRCDVQEEEEPIRQEKESTMGNGDERETPVQREEDPTNGEESWKERAFDNEMQKGEEPVDGSCKTNQTHEESEPENLSTPPQVEPLAQWSDVRQSVERIRAVPGLHVNFAPAVAPADAGQWTPSRAPLRLLSIDEASDCTSFTSSSPCSSEPPSLTLSLHGNHRLDKRRRRKAGLRALRFLQQNSFSQHAVFCLLSGRPLVVIGGDESSVRKLVDALALFLPAPGPDGSAVLPCLTTPLQLTDLLTWRLMGIHRTPSTSSSGVLHSLTRYSRYLALLDLDQRTLRCPPYSGSLISRLADPHTIICRGSTYLLHLESCLTALTNQALLYTFHPAFYRPDVCGRDAVAQRKDFLSTWGFCRNESDLRVMDFLSELIKRRHAGCGPPVLSFSHSSVHLHRNTSAT